MAENVQIPTCISGWISEWKGPDFCMDGATHLVHSRAGVTRLKARNKMVVRLLDQATTSGAICTVCGYAVWGPECMHVSVYSVEPTADFIKRAKEIEAEVEARTDEPEKA